MPIDKKIRYPIFLVCRGICESSTLKKFFEALAYGEPIEGCTIVNGTHIVVAETSVPFKGQTAKEICENIGKILNEHPKEPDFQSVTASTKLPPINLAWSEIKANARKTFIVSYCTQMGKLYNLSLIQVKTLYALITLGLQLKFVTNADIVLCEGQIQSIKGINISQSHIYVDKRLYTSQQQQHLQMLLSRENLLKLEINAV